MEAMAVLYMQVFLKCLSLVRCVFKMRIILNVPAIVNGIDLNVVCGCFYIGSILIALSRCELVLEVWY